MRIYVGAQKRMATGQGKLSSFIRPAVVTVAVNSETNFACSVGSWTSALASSPACTTLKPQQLVYLLARQSSTVKMYPYGTMQFHLQRYLGAAFHCTVRAKTKLSAWQKWCGIYQRETQRSALGCPYLVHGRWPLHWHLTGPLSWFLSCVTGRTASCQARQADK